MAATRTRAGSVLMAALALPGVVAPAVAENAPENAVLAYKQLYYHDSQSGLERITVNSPSLYLQLPIGETWSVESSAVLDSVSGASPRYHTVISGASKMDDMRRAFDTHLSYYLPRSAFGLSFSTSREHDYVSNAVSADLRVSSEDNNTTFNVGAGYADDTIDPVNDIVSDEKKRTLQFVAGVTRAMTRFDLLQLQLGYASGNGYYSDPYKLADERPDARRQATALLRWNHHFNDWNASLRLHYRYYGDSWDIAAHTAGIEWVQRVSEAVTLTPGLTYYTQSAARFYVDPAADGSVPIIPPGIDSSLDQRLSAFGALSFSQKLEWRLGAAWTADLKGEYYVQQSSWCLNAQGSPGLDSFRFYALQFGLARRF